MASYYQSTHSISVNASAEKIYEALTDWPTRSKWRKGIEIIWEGEPKASVNQKVTFHVKRGLLPYSFSFRITGLEPPRRFYMEYTGKPLRGRAAVEINSEHKGCNVAVHWMKVEAVGLLPWLYLKLGLGMRSHRKHTLQTLRMLKQHLEQPRMDTDTHR
jgi:hypothetical protein